MSVLFIFQLLRFIVTFLSLSIHFFKKQLSESQLNWSVEWGHRLSFILYFSCYDGSSGYFSALQIVDRVNRGDIVTITRKNLQSQNLSKLKYFTKTLQNLISFNFSRVRDIFCTNLHIEINILRMAKIMMNK